MKLPGPRPLPVLGNMLQLQGEPHHALDRLAATHDPVMSLKLSRTAHDVLQRHDHVLVARWMSDARRALGSYDHSVVWLPGSSPLWKRLRAVCTKPPTVSSRRAVGEGAGALVGFLLDCHHAGGEEESVDVRRVVFACVLNVVSNALFSPRTWRT
jgi:hypothetical protein